MKNKLISNCLIETEIVGDPAFFEPYMSQSEWVDSNILYGYRIPEITDNKPMVHHFIKHIDTYDLKLKKFVLSVFHRFGIQSRDFRCDFFLVKPGGFMPPHIDSQSQVAILLPLTPNTGALVCEARGGTVELVYQNLVVLNTQVRHQVNSPTSDRLLFRIGVHDVPFETILDHLNLNA